MDDKTQQTLFDYLEKPGSAAEDHSDREPQLAGLEDKCRSCNLCVLRSGCRQVVFGAGSPRAALMLVGEAPGADEDRLGKPFVGAAGKLLTRILEAAGLDQEQIYITNVVKCRPPHNRLPESAEVAGCLPYLQEQIKLIEPSLIVCLGLLAAQTLLGRKEPLKRMRGQWYEIDGRLYMPTYHPAALLRDSSKKRPVWEDFKEIARCYQQIGGGG